MQTCETILIIEDDEPIREAISYALEAEGYRVLSAADGRSGLETLRAAQRPCLILLDLMLPIMNGWEFLDVIRKDSSDILASIPVVITSAAGAAATTAAKQADGYIKKPIELKKLYEMVEKFCGPPAPDLTP